MAKITGEMDCDVAVVGAGRFGPPNGRKLSPGPGLGLPPLLGVAD